MKKLIINADDFGYREGINKGVIFAHKNGLVSSASLFVEREGSEEAVRLARENPALGLGPHVDLDKFFEIDHHAGSIVKWLDPRPAPEQIEAEIKRQLDKFYSFGFVADHFDSHHHSHLEPEIFPIACRLAREYKIKVIRFFSKFYSENSQFDALKKHVLDNNLIAGDHFIEGWYWGNVDEPYEVAELMTHPGYGEIWREAELAHCCQRNLRDYFVAQKIDLVRFSDLK